MDQTSQGLFLQASIAEFKRYQKLAEESLAQVSEAEWFYIPAPENNSIAIIVKHLAGNLRSRWTDFLSSDGEKPDRVRDREFELEDDTLESLRQGWEAAWKVLLDTLEALGPQDLSRTITIRAEPHSVPQAIQRSLAHTAYHVGQIVLLAKQIRGADFHSLSIPKGQSQQFLQAMREQHQK